MPGMWITEDLEVFNYSSAPPSSATFDINRPGEMLLVLKTYLVKGGATAISLFLESNDETGLIGFTQIRDQGGTQYVNHSTVTGTPVDEALYLGGTAANGIGPLILPANCQFRLSVAGITTTSEAYVECVIGRPFSG